MNLFVKNRAKKSIKIIIATIIILLFLLCFCIIFINQTTFEKDLASFSDDDYRASSEAYNISKSSIKNTTYPHTMILEKDASASESPPSISPLSLSINPLSSKLLNLKLTSADSSRYEVPNFNTKPSLINTTSQSSLSLKDLEFTYSLCPFGFEIHSQINQSTQSSNESSKMLIMKSLENGLVFSDKYIELIFLIKADRIFGYGEHVSKHFELCKGRTLCRYTLWNKDQNSPIADGEGGQNMYSTHPFFIAQIQNAHLFIAGFIRNSNAQEIEINKTQEGIQIKHVMLGGVLDFYFFLPNSVQALVKQYHELIGTPYLPPFWSLGYHQSRYGMKRIQNLKSVFNLFKNNDLPLDVLWNDIDYMKDYMDFTVDPIRYTGLKEFVQEIQQEGVRYVAILDAGIKIDENYPYFEKGMKDNLFIRSAQTHQPVVGTVWPGYCVFPDFFNPKTEELWHEGLQDLYDLVPFDGIWLDMNEISNNPTFCIHGCRNSNEFPSVDLEELSIHPEYHYKNEFGDLPFVPGGVPLEEMTIELEGYHYFTNENEERFLKEYNVHSLFSLMESRATFNFFIEKLNKRPFIISRSSFVGSGMFASKTLGDNSSTWEYLRLSIPGIYNFQLFGIPMVGSDICGFHKDAKKELCKRWFQLGVFYPFSRNQNDCTQQNQFPYSFDISVQRAFRNAMRQKYSILRYYYTTLFEISLSGGILIQPLFFEFPEDPEVYHQTEEKFLIGNKILASPTLYESQLEIQTYFPNSNWYDLRTFAQICSFSNSTNESLFRGVYKNLEVSDYFTNLHLRGGSIIPYQNSSTCLNTKMLHSLPLDLIIALDQNQQAHGTFLFDDGVSPDVIKNGSYESYQFFYANNVLNLTNLHSFPHQTFQFEIIANIFVLGLDNQELIHNLPQNANVLMHDHQELQVPLHYDANNNFFRLQFLYTRDVYLNEIQKIEFFINK